MNWRTWMLTGVLAASLNLSLALPAKADPPPWAGVWRHNKHVDRDWDDDDWEDRHRDWHRRNDPDRSEGRYYGGGYGSFDARCGQIVDRMRTDRNKIREIEPTGRHRKALQWYRDDLENARRDMANCRNQVAYDRYDSYDSYDRYGGSYDPYYGGGGSFDWKRDWPMLLGGFLNP